MFSCGPCRAKDCGSCRYCLDNPSRGGPNITKQVCENRRCVYLKTRHAEEVPGKRPKLAATDEEKALEPAAHIGATKEEPAPRIRRITDRSLAREGYSTPSGPFAPPAGAMIVVKFRPEWFRARVISSTGSQARAVYEDGAEEDITFPDDDVRVVVPEKAAAVMPSSIVAAARPASAKHPIASDSDADDDKLISVAKAERDNEKAARAKLDAAAAAAAKGELTQASKKREVEADRGEEAKPRKRTRVYALAANGALVERFVDAQPREAPATTKISISTASLNNTDAIEFDQEIPVSASSASQGWARFARFRSARTVGEALALGSSRTDIVWHLARGNARFVVS